MTERLPDRRAAILTAIRNSMRTRGYPPSMREIADAVGLSSTSSVAHHLVALEADGALRRAPGLARGLVVADIHPDITKDKTVTTPITDDLHRARTALRQACIDCSVYLSRRVRMDRRTWEQAGVDALRRIDASLTYLTAAREALAAALNDEAVPAGTGTAPDPKKEITHG